MISGNGCTGGARVYRRIESLVKAGVPAFLLAAPLRAYILTHSKMGKILYIKKLYILFYMISSLDTFFFLF